MSTAAMIGRVRGRVQTQWLALAAALVVLAGVLVAWGLSRAAERVEVVQVARQVKAGEELERADLQVTGVAYDGAVTGLVPASSLERLVGRVAAVDLQSGALVQVGMWTDEPSLLDGEDRVGAVLQPGEYPAGLGRGDVALAASIDGAAIDGAAFDDVTNEATNDEGGSVGGSTGISVSVRVLDVIENSDGGIVVTLAVPVADSIDIARLAASDRLVLVGRATAGES